MKLRVWVKAPARRKRLVVLLPDGNVVTMAAMACRLVILPLAKVVE